MDARGESAPPNLGGSVRNSRAEQFLKIFDENRDDQVSREEFEKGRRTKRLDARSRETLFKRLDKNENGFISLIEVKGIIPRRGVKRLSQADHDRDDKISREEFLKHFPSLRIPVEKREKIFKRLDHNSDGFLDHKDGYVLGALSAARDDESFSRIRLKEADINQSGSLSWGEFRNFFKGAVMSDEVKRRRFQRLDADQDGEISASELRAVSGRKKEKNEARK